MKNYKIYQLVLLLTPFVFSFALGLDIYIPIVPMMTDIFETTPSMVQLTLSLFLFITGAGQLLIGPLSDQFGRKPVFYAASASFILGSLGCAFASDINWLIFWRIVSAFGACAMLANSFALVRDLFSGEKSAKMFGFLSGAIGISPTLAPIVGGYLAVYFGWQSIFFFLALIGCLSLFVTYQFIQETHAPSRRIKVDKAVFLRYVQIFFNRQFIIYSSIAGAAEAVFFCFFSISPFIIIELLEVPTHEFGYYFAVFGLSIGIGGFISGKAVEKIGIPKTVSLGIAMLFLGGVSMLLWHYAASLTLVGFLIPMAIACTGAMFVVGSSAAGALEPFGEMAGTASAAFGALEFGVAAIVGSILMIFPVNSTIPYGISILLMGAICLGLFASYSPSKAIKNIAT